MSRVTVLVIKSADQSGVKNILVLYGVGDHGGGPNPDDVAGIAKLNASPDDVRVKPTNVANYIDLLLTEKKDFPVYDKELEGVFHGCYTTQFEMKRHNRHVGAASSQRREDVGTGGVLQLSRLLSGPRLQ